MPGHVLQLQTQLGQGQAVDAQIRRQPRFRRQGGRVRLHGGAVRQDGIDLFTHDPVHAVKRVRRIPDGTVFRFHARQGPGRVALPEIIGHGPGFFRFRVVPGLQGPVQGRSSGFGGGQVPQFMQADAHLAPGHEEKQIAEQTREEELTL